MTPEASLTAIKIAENQYAIPAQEKTKRAVEATKRTRQETWRFVVVGVCVVVASYVMYSKPETGWPLAALVGVFGGAVAAPPIIDKLKRKAPPEDE